MSKSLQEWLDEYSESHQNKMNVWIHRICVPLIFISIYWLLYSIPLTPKRGMYINAANIVYILALVFWFRLSIKVGLIFLFIGFFLALLTTFIWSFYFYAYDPPFRKIALLVFSLSWVGQFIGHRIEGKNPSFFKDIQFLLIGPIWIVYKGTKK